MTTSMLFERRDAFAANPTVKTAQALMLAWFFFSKTFDFPKDKDKAPMFAAYETMIDLMFRAGRMAYTRK